MILHNLKNHCCNFLLTCDRFSASSLIWLITQIRPHLGPIGVCPFPIGCTQFAIMQLENHITPIAIIKTTIRLLQCNPLWLYWNQAKIHND